MPPLPAHHRQRLSARRIRVVEVWRGRIVVIGSSRPEVAHRPGPRHEQVAGDMLSGRGGITGASYCVQQDGEIERVAMISSAVWVGGRRAGLPEEPSYRSHIVALVAEDHTLEAWARQEAA